MQQETVVRKIGQCDIVLRLVGDRKLLSQEIHPGMLTKAQVKELVAMLQERHDAMS